MGDVMLMLVGDVWLMSAWLAGWCQFLSVLYIILLDFARH